MKNKRLNIQSGPDGTMIVLAPLKRWWIVGQMTATTILFPVFVLFNLLFFERMDALLTLFYFFLSAVWVYTFYWVIWFFWGSERLLLGEERCTKLIFNPLLSWNWHFERDLIKNVRLREPGLVRGLFKSPVPVRDYGHVAFDYGRKTVQFGACIDPLDARVIVATLSRWLGEKQHDR